MRKQLVVGAIVAVAAGAAMAQPVVPDGFTARRIAPLLDGQVPRLSAIDDPGGFGQGVITAVASNEIATFRMIEPSGVINSIASHARPGLGDGVLRVRYSIAGIGAGLLHATLKESNDPRTGTIYATIDASGQVVERFVESTFPAGLRYDFDFTFGANGLPWGAVLLDQSLPNQLAYVDTNYNHIVTSQNSVPPGRTDTDVVGFQLDPTGSYGGGLVLADTDTNTDRLTAIYELREVLAGGTYRAIYGPVHSGTRRYGDLAIVAIGDFGGIIYVTETLSDEVQQVAPDGTHTTWATGFTGIDSLSISPDGESMYVGDLSGVWLIRRSGNEPGPVVLTSDPSIPANSVLTGDAVTSFRIIFSEPVSFNDADVTITDARGEPVAFDASGSGSQFMLIGVGRPLFGDTYTITVADSVTSVATGEPLDGDGDGFAGGDAIIDITHRCPADTDGSGEADVNDFFLFLDWFAAGCGG